MPQDTPPSEPVSNPEKFKPQNVQDDGRTGPAMDAGSGPDTPQGSEHHTLMKSMNRQ